MPVLNAPDDDDRTVIVKKPHDDCANALPPGTRLGEFEIGRLIGEGGFGIVYLAEDQVLQRRVALKEYLPSSLARRGEGLTVSVTSTRHEDTFQLGLRSFLNEARLLAQFDHPALVKVYRFWEANGTAYMVMPFYQGATFKQAVQRDGAPDEARLRTLLEQLLEALDVLHGANCLHRDVAPDNVLMLASNKPVLLDFGAARRVITDRTQALTVILKPGYAPIEQYAEMAGLKQGPWTDVYALAGVAHFAITGSPPPPSIARTLTDPYVPLEQAAAGRYSPAFLRAIDRALAVKPEDRPQNVAEFRALLGDATIAPTTEARTVAPALAAAPRQRSRTAAWIGGAAAIAAALGAGAFFYHRQAAIAPALAPAAPEARVMPPVSAPPAVAPPQAAPPTTAAAPEAAPPAPPADEKALATTASQDSAAKPHEEKAAPEPPEAKTLAKVEKPVAPPPAKSRTAVADKAPRVAKREAALEPVRAEPRERPAPKPLAVAPAEAPQPAPSASNQLAAIAAATLDDGDKCLRAKQYDCAIANANSALRVDPSSARARKLKSDAKDAQRSALSQIKIE